MANSISKAVASARINSRPSSPGYARSLAPRSKITENTQVALKNVSFICLRNMQLIEILLLAASVIMIVGYHVCLYWSIKQTPEHTAFGRHQLSRRRWLQIYAGGKNELLIVQTLRNWIMSATFLASTAILLTLGLLGVAFTSDRISNLSEELNTFGSADPWVLFIKVLLLAFVFVSAFFVFSLAVRALTHAGFDLNIPDVTHAGQTPEAENLDLEDGAFFYFLGLRLYYLSIPLAFWLFGPTWLLVATIALLIALWLLD